MEAALTPSIPSRDIKFRMIYDDRHPINPKP